MQLMKEEIKAVFLICRDLQLLVPAIFEPRRPTHVKDIKELNQDSALRAAYSITPIMTEQKLQDGTNVVVRLGNIIRNNEYVMNIIR